jgi:integrase
MSTGIVVRHSRTCATQADRQATCTCKPSYRAEVYDTRARKKIRKTFPNLSEAKGWRHDAASALRKGTMRAPTKTTLREAADAWFEGAEAGAIRTRSGHVYKPSVIRTYRQGLRDHVLPELGAHKLHEIQRRDLQDLADRLIAKGLDPSTVRNAIAPVRCIYRRAVARGELAVNPTSGLELAAPQGRRERIADPAEAAALIAGLPDSDRALWAGAFFAGLRAGELQALRWEDVDLAGGLIRVERAYDPKAREYITPKSKAGKRTVPIPAVLRGFLVEHKLRSGRSEGLVFGRGAHSPFTSSNVRRRAHTAWKHLNAERADLELEAFAPIGLHEARHTFASLMIAAGVNLKALSTFMGHSSITITLDRYGHLLPGSEEEAAGLLDAYLERVTATLSDAR